MKILVFHQYYLMPGQAGGSRFNELARLWSEAGHQVTVIAGTVDFGVFVLASALPHIENGRMIALGVTTPTRSPAAPDIPALAENPTLKGYDMNVWFGLFGPARLPQPMIARLNRELNEVLQEKDVRDKLAKAGISTEGGTPQKLTAFIQAETQRVRSVVTTAIAKGARP